MIKVLTAFPKSGCHSGAGDQGGWARWWAASISYDPADGDFVECAGCHGFGYAGVYDEATFAAHWDGKITFNDEMGYNRSTYNCATYCHKDNAKHNLDDSGWSTTSNTVVGPPLACTDCHAGAQASAGVNADSPHSTNTIFASKGVTYT